ncbi:MAG TPA: hypothetical protein VKX16_12675 [Chloroflexota bacterium]|nr:hypothetical protein [Chloroflexota bacterium]
MRKLIVLTGIALFLTGCRGTQAYTQQDLQQVRLGYAEIRPTYLAFKQAFQSGDGTGVVKYFRREQSECRIPDVIDNRDSIDPNVNLFQVSIALDDMCNAIESAYVTWAQAHGLPYDRNIVPGRPLNVFIQADTDLKSTARELRHPAALA